MWNAYANFGLSTLSSFRVMSRQTDRGRTSKTLIAANWNGGTPCEQILRFVAGRHAQRSRKILFLSACNRLGYLADISTKFGRKQVNVGFDEKRG